MANVKSEHRIAKIHMAAGLFICMTRDAKVIAEKLNTSERNVQRWSKTPEWTTALEAIGYEGDLSFRVNKQGRDPQRENPETFKKAHYAYHDIWIETGKGNWQCAVATAEELKQIGLDIEPRTIYNWAKRYGWRSTER